MKRPAFQFYPADWLSGTILLTPAQKGAYIDLLCYAWLEDDCGLPDDDRKLAVLSGLRNQWISLSGGIREKFVARDGRLYNAKLLSIRNRLDDFLRRSSEAGKQSAKVRATKNKPTLNQPSVLVQPTYEPNVNSSSSCSSSIKNIGFSSLQKTFAEFGKPTNERNWSRAAEAAVNSDLGDEEILGQVVPWFRERYVDTDPKFMPKPEDLLSKKPYPWRASQPATEPVRPKRTYDPIEPIEDGFFADCEDALNG
jgi:uncharacterized protein YdaU (DUF1376 family)